jgi:stage V sporulation protein AC
MKEVEPFQQNTLRPNWTQAEGFILGVGAKMFTIAGPVIVYGTVASVFYGVVYWVMQMI